MAKTAAVPTATVRYIDLTTAKYVRRTVGANHVVVTAARAIKKETT